MQEKRSLSLCHYILLWKTLFSCIGMGLFSHLAQAEQLSLVINGLSLHQNPPPDKDYNEKNWGVGLQYDYKLFNERWRPFSIVSGFSDSNKKLSFYGGAGVLRRTPLSIGNVHFDAGVVGFIMTRRNFNSGSPFLGVLPVFSVGRGDFALNITYIPKVRPKMVALWFVQLKVSLDYFR